MRTASHHRAVAIQGQAKIAYGAPLSGSMASLHFITFAPGRPVSLHPAAGEDQAPPPGIVSTTLRY